jgi:PAS domain S-box-containing protein
MARPPTPPAPLPPGRRRVSARAWRSAIIAGGLALVAAVAADRWFAGHLLMEARASARVAMTPYAQAVSGAVARRVALLNGLRSFADSRRTRAVLDEEFPLFSQGVLLATGGVRALQFVDGGRIVATWPVAGNEAALGYDLYSDPRPVLGEDVRRALRTGEVTVTGPIALVQGGEGLLVRQRILARPAFPELAAIIIDVPTLLSEAGLPATLSPLALELRDRSLGWFGGEAEGTAVAPESLTVDVPDGAWTLLGAPRSGWAGVIGAELRASRATSAALILAAALLGLVLGGREERLVREVAESGTRLDLAMRAGRMGAWEWDPRTGRVDRSAAAAAIIGEPSSDDGVQGPDRFLQRVHPDDRPAIKGLLEELDAGGRDQFVAEYRVLRDDGSSRWVIDIGELERDEAGRPTRLLGVVSDATERHGLEERLRHTQRLEAVGTLAGGIAHDFNNLLTAIIGFTELAVDRARELQEEPAAEDIRADLGQVLTTAARAAELTSQLLAFSRRKEAAPVLLDLSAAVRDVAPLLQRLLGGSYTLQLGLADGLRHVWADPGHVTQVLLNLVVNARDAMPQGGTVHLRTFAVPATGDARPEDAPPGEWVCVEVEDAGIGMSAELQARIFEPYFTTKAVGRGTGLGLAVAYGAVRGAGGQITVRSAPGEGSTFRIYLPARDPSTIPA